jgi:hypothetical protein
LALPISKLAVEPQILEEVEGQGGQGPDQSDEHAVDNQPVGRPDTG